MKLLVLVVLVAQVSFILASTCNFPPELWCSSEEIAAQCKVTKQCAETIWRLKANVPKVNVTLYFESLCHGCRQFIESMLYPSFLKISDIMQVALVPYGNARETKEGNKWKYDCQHGPDECVGNVIDTCSMYYMKTVEKYFPYIQCMEKSPSSRLNAAKECAGQYKAPLTEILACANSTLGNTLEHQMANITGQLQPPHRYVPWITLNGVHTERIQNEAEGNLIRLVCKTYQGTKPAACQKYELDTKYRCYR